MKRFGVYTLIAFLIIFPALASATPNKVWMLLGTRLTFTDSGSTGGNIDLANTGAGAGKYSDRYDKNALVSASGAMPYLWRWDISVQTTSAPTVNDVIELYVITSNGTQVQGNLGTTKAALATDKRKNLTLAGILIVDQTSGSTTMTASGYVEIRERYFSVAVWNATTQTLVNSAGVNVVGMTPQSLEIQSHGPLDFDKRTAAVLAA